MATYAPAPTLIPEGLGAPSEATFPIAELDRLPAAHLTRGTTGH
ncbi:hypothetical protein [Streptomyces sp. NPDC101165]